MTDAADQAIDIAPGSPGAMLRQLREARNFSIAEIAQRLKYGQRQIEALEHDDFEKLPGMTFVRGMIRGYVRLLGADPEAVLLELDRQRVQDPMTVDLRVSHIPFPDGKKRTTRIYGALSLLLILAAAVVGYEVLPWPIASSKQTVITEAPQSDRAGGITPIASDDKPITAQPAPLQTPEHVPTPGIPAPAQPASAATAGPLTAGTAASAHVAAATLSGMPSVGSKKISLQFDRESWVEIRQANGKTLLSQLNPGGSKQVIEGIPPFLVIIGNAPSVHLSYNDQPVDLRPHFKVDVARFTLE